MSYCGQNLDNRPNSINTMWSSTERQITRDSTQGFAPMLMTMSAIKAEDARVPGHFRARPKSPGSAGPWIVVPGTRVGTPRDRARSCRIDGYHGDATAAVARPKPAIRKGRGGREGRHFRKNEKTPQNGFEPEWEMILYSSQS